MTLHVERKRFEVHLMLSLPFPLFIPLLSLPNSSGSDGGAL